MTSGSEAENEEPDGAPHREVAKALNIPQNQVPAALSFQERVGRVLERFGIERADVYAGAWYDANDPFTVTIALREDGASALQDYERDLPLDLGTVKTVTVETSMQDLSDIQRKISDAYHDARSRGVDIRTVSLDIKHNRVVVTTTTAAALEEYLGDRMDLSKVHIVETWGVTMNYLVHRSGQ